MADDKFKEKKIYPRASGYAPISDEEEETYMYDIKKPMAFINEGENGVFDIKKQTGLNTAKSVFDKTTTFRTGL
jgi:hypothetical protein